MNILMVAAEMDPLVKVGGLADVTGALPRALVDRGHRVRVVLPLYGHLDRALLSLEPLLDVRRTTVRVGESLLPLRFWSWPDAPAGVTVNLVSCGDLFDRPGVYADPRGRGFADSLERASAHCQAALALPELVDWPVDILHAHDVQAALAPVYRQYSYAGRGLPGPAATLLTIHNLAHQELHDADCVETLGLPASLVQYPGPFEFYGDLNLLKGGISASDLVNTVSPTYAREVLTDPEFGCGLEGVLNQRGRAFSGILNGVDYDLWNPASDPLIVAAYDADDLSGKQVCRHRLLADVGLEISERPLLGMVGRLVPQKGLDLVTPLLDRIVAGGFSLVVLGTGDPAIQDALATAARAHPRRVAFLPEFSEAKAHAIYSGSDLFLMPSRFEPCGLSQLYALRYGSLPVVRRTGGLADTVRPVEAHDATGFVFEDDRSEALWGALEQARTAFADATVWHRLQQRAMACDFSWDTAAVAYETLYRQLSTAAEDGR